MKRYNILGVIPARGGSKGIKNKNIHLLNGFPLIYHTINEGMKSKLLTDLIVSTDSIDIKNISEKYGAECPFIRPKELSTDNALAIPTVQHAVRTYEKIVGFKYDFILMLQPTAPLRKANDIDSALVELITKCADAIISVVDVDNFHPFKMKTIDNGFLNDYKDYEVENPPRQELPSVFIVNGAIYATKRDVLMKQNTFKGKNCLPYIMPQERSVNIDNFTDFIVAEYYMNEEKVNY